MIEKNQKITFTINQLLFLFNYICCLTEAKISGNRLAMLFFEKKLGNFLEKSMNLSDIEQKQFYELLNSVQDKIKNEYSRFMDFIKQNSEKISPDFAVTTLSFDDISASSGSSIYKFDENQELDDVEKDDYKDEQIISSSILDIEEEN